MGKSNFYHVTETGAIVVMKGLREAIAAGKRSGYAWLDYCDPTPAELSKLIEPLRIHPLSIEDCTDENQIPKIEDFPSNTFMLFNDFRYAEQSLAIREVDIIIGSRFLVTVHRGDEGDTLVAGVERLAGLERESIRQGPAFLLHVLLDLVVDRKFIEIERMEEELGRMEEGLLGDLEHFEPANLLHLRRDLLAARKSLFYERENIRQGPAFLLHVLLDLVVDRKFVEIERMEEELGETEDGLIGDVEHFDPTQLLHLRRDLLAARKSLFYEREILVRVCRRDCPFVGERAIYMFRDIYDHLARLFELTETSRDMVTSLMEMHLSMLNNQMAQAANVTNATVRRLTFITTIFMPLTLLAGIGGMSEWSMMTGPSNWRIAYPLFILGMLIIAAINYIILVRWDRRTRAGT